MSLSPETNKNDKMEITQDELDQFEKGTLKLESLSAEKQAKFSEIMMSSDPVEAPSAGDKPLEVKEDSKDGESVSESKDKVAGDVVPGIKYKEKADEANTYKQQAEANKRELARIKAELESIRKLGDVKQAQPLKDSDQVWDPQFQVEQAERISKLEALVMQGVKGSREKLETLEKELEERNTFAELNAFTNTSAELRLDRPVEKANEEYLQFVQKLGASPEDMNLVDRYHSDATFRQQMESKGIKAPKDYEKLNLILKVYHRKNTMNYPNLDDAYLGLLREEGKLGQRLNGQYSKGFEDAVNKIANNASETTILDPSKTNGGGTDMSESEMDAWMRSNPNPVTSTQKATMAKIQAYLQAQAYGQE